MLYTWGEAKRLTNLAKHGLYVADAERVLAGPLVIFEDRSAGYQEQRLIGMGLLDLLFVLIVHVEQDDTIRIISMRKADRYETELFYRNAGYF